MIYDRRSALAGYVSKLLSTGRTDFTSSEAEEALGISHGAFLDAAERLQRRKALISPRQGFYVVVPPQYGSWGAPPPAWYIDALMRYQSQPYYVGLLKAGELHGATHQAVMEFQVVSSERFSRIRAGRSLITFYFRKSIASVAAGIEKRKTDTGAMNISSAALTALDLLRYPQASGGMDNVVTVLSDLSSKIDREQLGVLAAFVERPVVQRLGHLLETLGHPALTEPLLDAIRARGPFRWTELDSQAKENPEFHLEPPTRDAKWRVIGRRVPEPDW